MAGSTFGVDSGDERCSCFEFKANVGTGVVFGETKAASGVDQPEMTEGWSGDASPGLCFQAIEAVVFVDVAELILSSGEGKSADVKAGVGDVLQGAVEVAHGATMCVAGVATGEMWI